MKHLGCAKFDSKHTSLIKASSSQCLYQTFLYFQMKDRRPTTIENLTVIEESGISHSGTDESFHFHLFKENCSQAQKKKEDVYKSICHGMG